MMRLSLCVILAMVLLGCERDDSSGQPAITTDADPTIKLGIAREQVIKKLGHPARKQDFVKNDQPIWGVIEEWWEHLQNGDEVEIWDYTRKDGTFSVYFLNSSDAVWHTAFVRNGVVF